MSKESTAHNCSRLCARLLPWAGRCIALLFFLHLPGSAWGQGEGTENPNKVKAAYLRNFAHYVTWPINAFTDARSPWGICILGGDPFGEVLENALKGRMEQGRPFEIFRADVLNKLPQCQIIFVTYKDAAKRRGALAVLKNKPALTVGDAPDFLQEGGIIRFHAENKVEMSINLDQARSVSLKIQTKMLEVSRAVLENGAVRRQR